MVVYKVKVSLKLEDGWVITPNVKWRIWLLIDVRSFVNLHKGSCWWEHILNIAWDTYQ